MGEPQRAEGHHFNKMLKSFFFNDATDFDDGGNAGDGLNPEDCKFPMWVCPIDKVIEVTSRAGDLPCHEDLQKEGLLVQYDPRTMGKCLFFSHTWLRFKHPDSAEGVKKKLINEICSGIVSGSVAFHAYWFAVVAHHMEDVPSTRVTTLYSNGFVWLVRASRLATPTRRQCAAQLPQPARPLQPSV